jgi:cell pole-organizing protein PopZ
MGDIANEPSMEDILSSIKRIIAEDADTSAATARARAGARRRAAAAPVEPVLEPEIEDEDEVLELTETVAEEERPLSMEDVAQDPELISDRVAQASRMSLESLTSLIVKPEGAPNTLEGLVREMLRPMLKEWLDANLPELVERMVSKEIRRITGKDL